MAFRFGGPLLIVRDRLQAHKSRLVQDFIALSQRRIETGYPPGYAPELNPVECLRGCWKQHELPNVRPSDYWELDAPAPKALRRMRRKPTLAAALWKQPFLRLD